jgi:hypothetical protein
VIAVGGQGWGSNWTLNRPVPYPFSSFHGRDPYPLEKATVLALHLAIQDEHGVELRNRLEGGSRCNIFESLRSLLA